jgi:hypothetical protein
MAKIIKFPRFPIEETLILSSAQQELSLTLEIVKKIEPVFGLLTHITQSNIFTEVELNNQLLKQLNNALQQITSVLQERNYSLLSVLEDMNRRASLKYTLQT